MKAPLAPLTAQARERLACLWPAARRCAARRCHYTLQRLARGDGGFYDADDFWQDLFLEFVAVAQQPGLAAATWEDAALRAAWDRALWGGGLRILRRAPQRLWRRFAETLERPTDPAMLDGATLPVGPADDAWPGAAALNAHLRGEDGRATQETAARLTTLAAALARLRPAQRQALYMLAIQGLPAHEAAARLGLPSANAVAQRASAARRRLARELRDG